MGATDGVDKLSADKKVHWNCKYVQLLLDCVESRMAEFKNKSIHKKVWDDIGRQMLAHGFSTEHCYNKWKNLRRDVRMFAINPHKATKNQDTLARVKRLISTICPNFDPTAVYKKSTKSPNKHSEESSNSLEPLTKLLTPPTSPFSDMLTPVNNENMEIQEADGAAAAAAAAGAATASPGDAVYSYLLQQQQQHQQLLFHPNLSQNLFLNAADKPDPSKPSPLAPSAQCLHRHHAARPDRAASNKLDDSSSPADPAANHGKTNSNYSNWPYELYDLLVSFRSEEVKQAHSIDQLIRQINEIRDSSVRRMNTIQQLMNLANLLINSKVS